MFRILAPCSTEFDTPAESIKQVQKFDFLVRLHIVNKHKIQFCLCIFTIAIIVALCLIFNLKSQKKGLFSRTGTVRIGSFQPVMYRSTKKKKKL